MRTTRTYQPPRNLSKAHGAGTLVRGNDAQSEACEVTKRLALDISVCMAGLNNALLA